MYFSCISASSSLSPSFQWLFVGEHILQNIANKEEVLNGIFWRSFGTCLRMKQQWERNMCTLFLISGYLPSVKPVFEFSINCTYNRNKNSSYLCFRLHVISRRLVYTFSELDEREIEKEIPESSGRIMKYQEIGWVENFRKNLSSVEIGQLEEFFASPSTILDDLERIIKATATSRGFADNQSWENWIGWQKELNYLNKRCHQSPANEIILLTHNATKITRHWR